MRGIAPLVESVLELEQNTTTLSAPDATQRLTDLRTAGVASGSFQVGDAQLTAFGHRFAFLIRRLDLGSLPASTTPDYAIPRMMCLIKAGIETNEVRYVEFLTRWTGLRRDRSAEDWVADAWGLTAAQYLLVEEGGYVPYVVMRGSGLDPWATQADLLAWGSAMANPSGWSESRLAKLTRTIHEASTRAADRMNFCKALEAYVLHTQGLGIAREWLTRQGLSNA